MKLTPAEIERITTKLRQTKITRFFGKKHTENLLEESSQKISGELNNENLPLPSPSSNSSSDYEKPKTPSKIKSRGNFARKRTNPIYGCFQDCNENLPLSKENVEVVIYNITTSLEWHRVIAWLPTGYKARKTIAAGACKLVGTRF